MMNKYRLGFTLVELVISIIIIAILSLYAIPKLLNSGYGEISLRHELISQIQLLQTQNMQHRSQQYCLQINPSDYFSGQYGAGACVRSGDHTGIADGLSVSQGILVFDSMGRVNVANSSLCAAATCIITITGASTYLIRIESEGYIHEG